MSLSHFILRKDSDRVFSPFTKNVNIYEMGANCLSFLQTERIKLRPAPAKISLVPHKKMNRSGKAWLSSVLHGETMNLFPAVRPCHFSMHGNPRWIFIGPCFHDLRCSFPHLLVYFVTWIQLWGWWHLEKLQLV